MLELSALSSRLDPGPSQEPAPGDRAAAVLTLMIEEPAPALLFTERAAAMSRHAGEISFPGGLRDPGDGTLRDTALREAHEEVGLDPLAPRILGALAPIHTFVSAILVTPFVAVIATLPPLTLSAGEIARAFTVPVRTLVAVEEHHVLHRDARGTLHGWRYDTGDATIWGATGFILHALLDLLQEEAPWLMS